MFHSALSGMQLLRSVQRSEMGWKESITPRDTNAVPLSVIVKEEEELVFQYWSADVATKLMEVVSRL